MFVLLRFIRGFCGFVFALQIIQLIESVTWLLKPESAGIDMSIFFALVLIKVVVLGASGFLFFWLRDLINNLYIKKHGTPHPSLADKKWSL